MKSINRERGITMWGLIFVLGVLAFTLFVGFKLLPPYLNDLKVSTALKSLQKEAGTGVLTREEIIQGLDRRLVIDDTRHVDVRKNVLIQAKGNQREVKIVYDVVVPLFANVSILLDFEHAIYLSGGG